MGRGQKRSWGGRGGRGGGRGDKTWHDEKRSKTEFTGRDEMRNSAFEEYYRAQGIVPEGEWEDFLATLRRPLPVTFRINGSGKFADHLRDKLKQDFFAKLCSSEITVDGEAITPPRQLPWYPNGYAWQLEFSRNQLRKLPLLTEIHDFVKYANDAGSISRQEAVSMVPPLFLDVQPEHRVLDMCAAPGSKTFQLLEALHSGSRPGQTPPGFVVANDADFMRCNLLTHQTKRVCSPCLMVTNHDASRFPAYLAGVPTLEVGMAPPPTPCGGEVEVAGDGASAPAHAVAGIPLRGGCKPQRYRVRFDRILADVPCSGDGTLRKSPDIWRKWNISGGNSLHPIQLRIAMHGAKLLEVGGRMVYSTCTFNPVEDEAVVGELLLRSGGALELLDVSRSLPELRHMAGKTHWKVRDRHRFYDRWDEARELSYKLEESMFSSPAKAALPLERCMRFLPHHGDTGGFFVAVLRKVSELPDSKSAQAQERKKQRQKGNQPQPAAEVAVNGTDPTVEAADEEDEEDPAVEALCSDAPEDGNQHEEAVRAVEEEEEGLQQHEEADGHGAKAVEVDEEVEKAPSVLELARAAAEEAVIAAEMALEALNGGDVAAANRGSTRAEAAARAATHVAQRERHATLRRDQQQQKQEVERKAEGEEQTCPSTVVQVSWTRGGGGRGRSDGGKFAHMDPVAPLEDEAVLGSLYDYYGISPDFPLRSQLVMRSLDRQPKRLYFVSRSVLDVMMRDSGEALKIVSTGLKVFERQVLRDQINECPYRLSQEGLPLVLPYITRQRLEVPPAVLLLLLRERNLILPEAAATEGDTTASGNPRGTKPTLTDESVLAALDPLKLGCVVCELSAADAHRLGFAASIRCTCPEETRALLAVSAITAPGETGAAAGGGAGDVAEQVTGGLAANAPLAVVAWKGKASLAVMVEKSECAQMIDKLDAELKKLKPAP